jgi:hypothetical protein
VGLLGEHGRLGTRDLPQRVLRKPNDLLAASVAVSVVAESPVHSLSTPSDFRSSGRMTGYPEVIPKNAVLSG